MRIVLHIGLEHTGAERLQKVLLELNCELDAHAEHLGLDPSEQLRELTAAISAQKQADVVCNTKAELLSRLLEVVWNAIVKLEEDVAPLALRREPPDQPLEVVY